MYRGWAVPGRVANLEQKGNMQTPEGNFQTLKDLVGDEELEKLASLDGQLVELQQKANRLEKESGKPHPVFVVGEEIEIKGGRFRVHKILRNRLMLKPIRY